MLCQLQLNDCISTCSENLLYSEIQSLNLCANRLILSRSAKTQMQISSFWHNGCVVHGHC